MTAKDRPVRTPRKVHLKQNGQVRPADDTLTGYIWALCDSMTADKVNAALASDDDAEKAAAHNLLVTQDEVWDVYSQNVEAPARATVATQYGRWVAFYAYQARADIARKAARDNLSATKLAERQKDKEHRAAQRREAAERKRREAAEAAARAEAEQVQKTTPAPDEDVPYLTE